MCDAQKWKKVDIRTCIDYNLARHRRAQLELPTKEDFLDDSENLGVSITQQMETADIALDEQPTQTPPTMAGTETSYQDISTTSDPVRTRPQRAHRLPTRLHDYIWS